MEDMIKSIRINGLYGTKDYLIKFNKNKLIMIGENGSGKTTIARIVFATLSCNWDLLQTFPFSSIQINFNNNTTVDVSSAMIKNVYKTPDIERFELIFDNRHSNRYYEGMINHIIETKEQFENSGDILYTTRNTRNYFPVEYYSNILKNPNVNILYNATKTIRTQFKSKILYLPTYRRIEEPLRKLFPDVEREIITKKRKRNVTDKVIELVEFGMDDVTELVERELSNLKSYSQTQQNILTLKYLGEIVSKAYDNSESYYAIRSLNDMQIDHVLSRIDSNILSEQSKEELKKILNIVKTEKKQTITAHAKIVCHYFMQLLRFVLEINMAERRITDFQNKCNKYLVNKRLEYNSQEFSCNLIKNGNNIFEDSIISFQNLSSGEKQIVSLFSHIYLNKDEEFFVFIDEPELSLSVDWQRMLLPDIVSSANCKGLFATTHSPFVFDNELETLVHGIDEFCVKG